MNEVVSMVAFSSFFLSSLPCTSFSPLNSKGSLLLCLSHKDIPSPLSALGNQASQVTSNSCLLCEMPKLLLIGKWWASRF